MDFDRLWSEVSPAVDAALRARGLGAHDRADVLQEVAVRAIRAINRGTEMVSFEAWCKTVARNCANNLHRRNRFVQLPDDFDSPAPGEDVERRVHHRLELDAVVTVVQSLDDNDRSLLIRPLEPSGDAVARNRHYVAVHRLRKRVRLLVESVMLGLVGWSCIIRRRFAGVAGVAAIAATGVVASVVVLAPHTGAPHRPRSMTTTTSSYQRTAYVAGDSHSRPSHSSPTTSDTRRYRLDTPLPGRRAVVYTRPPGGPDEPLVCAALPPVADRACVAHPLRQRDGAPVTVR